MRLKNLHAWKAPLVILRCREIQEHFLEHSVPPGVLRNVFLLQVQSIIGFLEQGSISVIPLGGADHPHNLRFHLSGRRPRQSLEVIKRSLDYFNLGSAQNCNYLLETLFIMGLCVCVCVLFLNLSWIFLYFQFAPLVALAKKWLPLWKVVLHFFVLNWFL